MENPGSTFTREEIKEHVNLIFPYTAEFLAHVKPFLTNYLINEEYKKFTLILKKVGFNNVDDFIRTYQDMLECPKKYMDSFIDKALEIVKTRYSNINDISSLKQLIDDVEQTFSIEKIIPISAEMTGNSYAEYQSRIEEWDNRVNNLAQEERDIYEYFSLLVNKLWISYIISNFQGEDYVAQIFLKGFVISYYKRMQAFYDKEICPKKLIDHIESIKIPYEKELMEDSPAMINEPIQPSSVPIFRNIDEIYPIIKHHFNVAEHESLKKLLEGTQAKDKLTFTGQGNQLADAFKKIYNAQLITGCNKQQLIKWIVAHFKYKGRGNKYVVSDTGYLSKIISGEQNPCKNPILEIRTDPKGEISIVSPERKAKGFNKK